MTKHYAISRWTLTGKPFVSTMFGEASAAEAEARALRNEKTYQDQTFIRTVEAAHFNDAQAQLKALRLRHAL